MDFTCHCWGIFLRKKNVNGQESRISGAGLSRLGIQSLFLGIQSLSFLYLKVKKTISTNCFFFILYPRPRPTSVHARWSAFGWSAFQLEGYLSHHPLQSTSLCLLWISLLLLNCFTENIILDVRVQLRLGHFGGIRELLHAGDGRALPKLRFYNFPMNIAQEFYNLSRKKKQSNDRYRKKIIIKQNNNTDGQENKKSTEHTFLFSSGHSISDRRRKNSQEPSEMKKISYVLDPLSPPWNERNFTSGFNSRTSELTKRHLKLQVWITQPPSLPNVSPFRWASVIFLCDGPLQYLFCNTIPV